MSGLAKNSLVWRQVGDSKQKYSWKMAHHLLSHITVSNNLEIDLALIHAGLNIGEASESARQGLTHRLNEVKVLLNTASIKITSLQQENQKLQDQLDTILSSTKGVSYTKGELVEIYTRTNVWRPAEILACLGNNFYQVKTLTLKRYHCYTMPAKNIRKRTHD